MLGRHRVQKSVDTDFFGNIDCNGDGQMAERREHYQIGLVLPYPGNEFGECRWIHAAQSPMGGTGKIPILMLLVPEAGRLQRQRNRFTDLIVSAQAPLHSAVADINYYVGLHTAASTGAASSSITTFATSCASPWPVTAETANTSLPSSCSSRMRTSSLPVSSALLTAIISGFSARAPRCSSSSRRIT